VAGSTPVFGVGCGAFHHELFDVVELGVVGRGFGVDGMVELEGV